MDPIDSITPKKDSSLAMLLEAERRGAEIHYMLQGDLRLVAGETVSPSDREAFVNSPAVDLWRRSLKPNAPTTTNISNWLDAAFATDEDAPTRGKANPNRRLLADSYRYSFGHRALVDSLLEDFRVRGACELADRIDYWVAKDNLPADDPVVVFLPALSEIRIENDTLLVDTGTLVAGGVDQAVDQIASLIYRNRQVIDGENPSQTEGGVSVANAFRVSVNEGLAGWIARNPETEFRDDHPRLGSIKVVPETFYHAARRVLDYGGKLFPDIMDDPAAMEERGRSFTNFMTGQNAYGSLGYAMASVIVAHGSEDKLREAGRSVPGFLAAYQEAAAANPVPAPEPGAAGTELYQTMPPLEPAVFEGLMDLLRATFPE